MNIVKTIEPFFVDERGEMSHLLEGETPITSAVLITSKKGAIRANHYHKHDTHHVYIIKGSMEYTYQAVDDPEKKKHTVTVKAGQLVTSPPMTMHAMKFLEDSIFIALTTEARDQEKYEEDTVRVGLI